MADSSRQDPDHKRMEAQDRPKKSSGPRSPVDTQHVDAPTKQKNERGHRHDAHIEE